MIKNSPITLINSMQIVFAGVEIENTIQYLTIHFMNANFSMIKQFRSLTCLLAKTSKRTMRARW